MRRLERELAQPTVARRRFRVAGMDLGWLDDERARSLARFSDVFQIHGDAVEFAARVDEHSGENACDQRSAAIAPCVRALAATGALTAWRNERYGIRERFDEDPALLIERAAARFFGVRTYAAHANGLTGTRNEPQMWLARRSPHKAIDPGMLDNLVGGGIAYGSTPLATVVKEAWEEAGIPPRLAGDVQRGGTIDMAREVPDGLQRETIYVYDLWIPNHFTPANQDGEAVEHRCVDLAEAARLLANATGPDVVTVDATLVAVDFLLRHDVIAHGPDRERLSALLQAGRAARFDRAMTMPRS
ncbi:MAG TPA: DUF4743 domain-containing protein [Casimicrobiaceae bacterium]|nr:DUF4743 domain-containing protein [Casimicrobiaceae bacterium]